MMRLGLYLLLFALVGCVSPVGIEPLSLAPRPASEAISADFFVENRVSNVATRLKQRPNNLEANLAGSSDPNFFELLTLDLNTTLDAATEPANNGRIIRGYIDEADIYWEISPLDVIPLFGVFTVGSDARYVARVEYFFEFEQLNKIERSTPLKLEVELFASAATPEDIQSATLQLIKLLRLETQLRIQDQVLGRYGWDNR